jgi:hypothetical protein
MNVSRSASAACLEAFQLGKFVISIDVNKELNHVKFLNDGKAFYCTNKHEVDSCMKIILSDLSHLSCNAIKILDYKRKLNLQSLGDIIEFKSENYPS